MVLTRDCPQLRRVMVTLATVSSVSIVLFLNPFSLKLGL